MGETPKGLRSPRCEPCDYTRWRHNAKRLQASRIVKTPLRVRIALFLVAALVGGEKILSAQEPAPAPDTQPAPSLPAAPRPKPKTADKKDEHRFWDKTNDWLFAGVGASRTLDYFSTLNMRRRGDQEILLTNAIVDNHAEFAAIEAAGTGVSIGASYLFHRYGHHKLERWTSIVHFGLATSGAVRNYSLKTAHPRTGP